MQERKKERKKEKKKCSGRQAGKHVAFRLELGVSPRNVRAGDDTERREANGPARGAMVQCAIESHGVQRRKRGGVCRRGANEKRREQRGDTQHTHTHTRTSARERACSRRLPSDPRVEP